MLAMAKRSISNTSSSSELDPLLRDLTEKRQGFRNRVSSLAAELRDVCSQLALKEGALARETLTKEAAEMKTGRLEEEVGRLREYLEERNRQLESSTALEEEYQKDLDDLRSQLAATQAAIDASAASTALSRSQCLSLMKELDEKSNFLNKQKIQISELEQQLEILQKDLQAREMAQKQLRNGILKQDRDLIHSIESIVEAGDRKDVELRNILEEVSTKELFIFNKQLEAKDEEITRLRGEVGHLSALFRDKEQEIESQLDKFQIVEVEMTRKALKLEFCLQELRSQERKLQREMEEKGDDTMKKLREQLPVKQYKILGYIGKHNFWESSGFKFVLSVSMFVLVLFSKR